MAFLLMHLDNKPMRVKAKLVSTGLAIRDDGSPIEVGKYYGIYSGKEVMVLNSGGAALPVEEARVTFACCQPVPIAIDESISSFIEPLNEIFIEKNQKVFVKEVVKNMTPLVKEVEGFWLPVSFHSAHKEIASGWVFQTEDSIKVRIIYGQDYRLPADLETVPLHASNSSFYVHLEEFVAR